MLAVASCGIAWLFWKNTVTISLVQSLKCLGQNKSCATLEGSNYVHLSIMGSAGKIGVALKRHTASKGTRGIFFFFGSLWIKWIFILRICNIELDKKYNILNTHAPAHRLRCKNIVKYSWNNCSPSLPSGVTNILNYRLIIFSFPLHFYYVCVVSVLKQCRNI